MDSRPQSLTKVADERFRIVWKDGHESVYPFSLLRMSCPCAHCRDERTGAPLLDPKTVPVDLKASRAELIGNYAVAFRFADGHSTGIYTFDLLRNLCPCCAEP